MEWPVSRRRSIYVDTPAVRRARRLFPWVRVADRPWLLHSQRHARVLSSETFHDLERGNLQALARRFGRTVLGGPQCFLLQPPAPPVAKAAYLIASLSARLKLCPSYPPALSPIVGMVLTV